MAAPPNFSAFPWDRVPRLSREQARAESVTARWLAARPSSLPRLAKLLGIEPTGNVAASGLAARVVTPSPDFDPHAAACIVRIGGASIEARGSSLAVRTVADRILGGPEELAAPRPLNVVEESIWCLVVATALEDLGIDGIVWPASSGNRTNQDQGGRAAARAGCLELSVQAADLAFAIQLQWQEGLELRLPPGRETPTWAGRAVIDVPVVLARCALDRRALGRLAPRSIVTIEPVAGVRVPRVGKPVIGAAELEILGGTVGIRPKAGPLAPGGGPSAASGAGDVVAEVVTGYVPRPMSLPDDAHVELTVGLGTTRMSLRQVFELAVGQVVTLGRPLAGPFELRAAGKLLGKGELVDVDGELAVRIVSLGDQE